MTNMKPLPIIYITLPYITQETSHDNIETYEVEVVISILHKIILTNLQGYVSQVEGRINNQILGVKELTRRTQRHSTLQRLLLPTSETEGSVYRQRKGRRVGGGTGQWTGFH